MAKKLIAILLLVCMVCGVLSACKAKEITSEEAYQIVLDDLGALAEKAESPHIHTGTYEGKACYNIYVTVEGMSLNYIVSETGKILSKGPGEHSH